VLLQKGKSFPGSRKCFIEMVAHMLTLIFLQVLQNVKLELGLTRISFTLVWKHLVKSRKVASGSQAMLFATLCLTDKSKSISLFGSNLT
jgi:hypothetical protein